MKRTRHTVDLIVAKLREADGLLTVGRTVRQIVRRLGVSEQAYNRWHEKDELRPPLGPTK